MEEKQELEVISSEVLALEMRLQELKLIQQKEEELKTQLFNLMQQYDIKKWTTTNGVQITRVDGKEESVETIKVFDEETFKTEHKDLYEEYANEQTKIVKGRKGFVKITLPKTIDYSKLGE